MLFQQGNIAMEMKEGDRPRSCKDRRVSYTSTLPHTAPKASGGIGGVLTRLFNIVCSDLTAGQGISPIRWNKLMNEYIRKASENNTSLDRSSIRGNTNKQLHKPSMTWNVLFKGLQFLKFEAFTIGICGEIDTGKEFNVYSSVSFVPKTRFENLFPKELSAGYAVQRKSISSARNSRRSFSNQPGGVLSRLFNLICLDITDDKGFSQMQWNELLTEFIEKHEGQTDIVKRLNDRSNLNKEFRLSKMTWKVFCKGLRFLRVAKFTLYITAYREDGFICNCETSTNFAPRK